MMAFILIDVFKANYICVIFDSTIQSSTSILVDYYNCATSSHKFLQVWLIQSIVWIQCIRHKLQHGGTIKRPWETMREPLWDIEWSWWHYMMMPGFICCSKEAVWGNWLPLVQNVRHAPTEYLWCGLLPHIWFIICTQRSFNFHKITILFS